jgi:hypothetical protein
MNRKAKQKFLELCISPNLDYDTIYDALDILFTYKLSKKDKELMMDDSRRYLNYKQLWAYNFTNQCRYCDKQYKDGDDIQVTYPYYKQTGRTFVYSCHKSCFQSGSKGEAYECQAIDTNCNDCGFFKRGEKSSADDIVTSSFLLFQSTKGFDGSCSNPKSKAFNMNVRGESNACQPWNSDCFVHRKDNKGVDI